ncbi:MAG: hypothetical protein N4A63_01950 [Vallitalea sp.]|jgi:hypothetical protein|nr:hypothetical protein [Vallitalea sp.]
MRLINKLKNLFIKNIVVNVEEKEYLGVDINNVYNNVENTYELCNKLSCAYKENEKLITEYDNITNIYTSIQQIDELNKKQLIEFENYADTYVETKADKSEFIDKIKSTRNDFEYLDEYKENIDEIISNIKNVEEKQRIVKNDINYLEGEKGDLLYNKERLKKAKKMVTILMISLLIIFSISALILGIIFIKKDIDIFIPSVIMIVIIAFFGLWIYIFRRYVIHEIKKNNILSQRAVELLNKIKIKYVNNKQFLDYEYKKYKVKSGDMLQDRWNMYKQNKEHKHRIHKMSSNIIILEQDIERLLLKNNINTSNYILDNINIFATKKARLEYKEQTKHDKDIIKKSIDDSNNQIKLIIKILIDVRDNDTTNNKIITKMINELIPNI